MQHLSRYKKLFLAVLIMAATTACKKSFLEIVPKGNLIAEKTNDYSLLLNNLDLLNVSTDAQVVMGDEIAAIESYFTGAAIRTQRLYRWDDVIYEPDQDATEMVVPLRNIYTYNKIINEVMNSVDGTEQQKKALRAEALAGRAWTYFLLINYYGKPYSTSSANDPGFPIVTKADVTETNFTRASVKEVYDFIVSDLTAAISDLPTGVTHRLRMSKGAAEAILGKVYVFMGKYNEALTQFNASFTSLSTSVIPVALYDYNVTFATGGSFLPIGLFGPAYPTVPNNQENIYGKQFINNWSFGNSEIVATQQTLALFTASDRRRNFFVGNPYPSGAAYPNGMLRRRGPAGVQIGFVLPELFLLRAECKARLNDLAGAKADVEALRIKRMTAADAPVSAATAADQNLLIRFILDERIREFAVQGFRWFDMRRLSVDPQFSSTVGTIHTIYNAAGAVVSTHTLKPERLVFRFPEKVINQNPGMQNNQ
ncbi:RagB/SusD family nutrient uptake outer membrane protein [Lacibacter sediminis]|uniref:RagB/SusD family nutrient uptake outer membrane protein n=1 Tax=Lacibacter sediminis TaxID=2760713 RepID=A0A7G5XKH8_9BACT|nr:RagB/SusD family nutrient uptake outer membrane protein [Lacibacter sediminis]QNA45981.1 RagB/SusD family nutrient uptake outer membrane protein [Lacibacter sediminis]